MSIFCKVTELVNLHAVVLVIFCGGYGHFFSTPRMHAYFQHQILLQTATPDIAGFKNLGFRTWIIEVSTNIAKDASKLTWWTLKANRTPCSSKNSRSGSFSEHPIDSSSMATLSMCFFANFTEANLICTQRGKHIITQPKAMYKSNSRRKHMIAHTKQHQIKNKK